MYPSNIFLTFFLNWKFQGIRKFKFLKRKFLRFFFLFSYVNNLVLIKWQHRKRLNYNSKGRGKRNPGQDNTSGSPLFWTALLCPVTVRNRIAPDVFLYENFEREKMTTNYNFDSRVDDVSGHAISNVDEQPLRIFTYEFRTFYIFMSVARAEIIDFQTVV